MRIDYYQLVRKWRVDLYRYGLRMTYDIVIPSPGADLLQKLEELRALDALIDAPFDFPLKPSTIDRSNWTELAAQWGAKVDFPPPEYGQVPLPHHEAEYHCTGGKGTIVMEAVEFAVDPDYEISSAQFLCHYGTCGDIHNYHFGVVGEHGAINADNDIYTSTLSGYVGMSGNLAVAYSARNIKNLAIRGTIHVKLTDVAFQRWQYAAWNEMRSAAEEAYYASRQTYIDRRTALAEQIKGWDALTLRKMEREEIMKGVLRWLFGPTFELVPAEIQAFFGQPESNCAPAVEQLTPTEANWSRVIRFGEMIKFMHQAIEWENVLYFTYPYFWDSRENWEFKRFLQHPDPQHREFLRAGSARVVLTIRPGFEVSFACFMETGALDPGHPYLTIAQEIQDYANTNYQGIPPANPADPNNEEEVGDRERGVLIGRWYEYTPTSALDLSIDTHLENLA
jgi:hypothetical protein